MEWNTLVGCPGFSCYSLPMTYSSIFCSRRDRACKMMEAMAQPVTLLLSVMVAFIVMLKHVGSYQKSRLFTPAACLYLHVAVIQWSGSVALAQQFGTLFMNFNKFAIKVDENRCKATISERDMCFNNLADAIAAAYFKGFPIEDTCPIAAVDVTCRRGNLEEDNHDEHFRMDVPKEKTVIQVSKPPGMFPFMSCSLKPFVNRLIALNKLQPENVRCTFSWEERDKFESEVVREDTSDCSAPKFGASFPGYLKVWVHVYGASESAPSHRHHRRHRDRPASYPLLTSNPKEHMFDLRLSLHLRPSRAIMHLEYCRRHAISQESGTLAASHSFVRSTSETEGITLGQVKLHAVDLPNQPVILTAEKRGRTFFFGSRTFPDDVLKELKLSLGIDDERKGLQFEFLDLPFPSLPELEYLRVSPVNATHLAIVLRRPGQPEQMLISKEHQTERSEMKIMLELEKSHKPYWAYINYFKIRDGQEQTDFNFCTGLRMS